MINKNITIPMIAFDTEINNDDLIKLIKNYFKGLLFKEIINNLSNNVPDNINKYTDKSISLIRNNLLEFLI